MREAGFNDWEAVFGEDGRGAVFSEHLFVYGPVGAGREGGGAEALEQSRMVQPDRFVHAEFDGWGDAGDFDWAAYVEFTVGDCIMCGG